MRRGCSLSLRPCFVCYDQRAHDRLLVVPVVRLRGTPARAALPALRRSAASTAGGVARARVRRRRARGEHRRERVCAVQRNRAQPGADLIRGIAPAVALGLEMATNVVGCGLGHVLTPNRLRIQAATATPQRAMSRAVIDDGSRATRRGRLARLCGRRCAGVRAGALCAVAADCPRARVTPLPRASIPT